MILLISVVREFGRKISKFFWAFLGREESNNADQRVADVEVERLSVQLESGGLRRTGEYARSAGAGLGARHCAFQQVSDFSYCMSMGLRCADCSIINFSFRHFVRELSSHSVFLIVVAIYM